MHTKWLVRHLVSQSGLAYALLGFLGGLLWLSLSARTTTLGAPTLNDAPRPVSAATTQRATLQDAITSVRQFAGQPSLLLEGGLQPEAEADQRADLFYLESVSPVRGEDFFKVDARTGEVVEATMRGRLAPDTHAATTAHTQPAAEAVASQFARTHFWGFDQLVLVDRSTRTGDSGTIYSFKWTQLAQESRAELPTSVSLAVSARSGQVFWYLSQRDPVQIDTRPAIAQDQAIEITQAWLQPRDERWDLAAPPDTRLQIVYDDDGRQQLVWSIQYQSRPEGPRASLRLLVDAQTGELIQSAS